jgi:hypothetical protein
MSVLGQPQHDWDDFLEDARKPRRRWSPSRVIWIVVAIAVAAVIMVYYYKQYSG